MATDEKIKRYLDVVTSDKSKILELSYDGKVLQPGQHIARSDAKLPPTLSFAVPSRAATYMVICIDLDGPYPSLNFLSPILHWIQPGFKPSAGSKVLTSSDPFVANYVGPGPPPGSSPHRYVFLLYEQPEGFDGTKHAPPGGKEYSNLARKRFALGDWEKKVNLSHPIAVNYFVSN
ncbi:hypothetical protein G647_08063 [Cladophialophora carrionii CBS 160.54]|uniref:YbhB/YbcL family Raf kinase inhibitor-like protein n=1 Tax=Cladophialophora carrionii CBS 160.54 TaxID=1279043 RepID=V9D4X5_9EURO|nr:uncharacterized protein G647_08063 [Cladophialophora carrionii CBS 160.54]ETI21716.1 hypothetical protein G647_08063 [Cladophialophora carrionii CBS 160.54]